MERRRAHLLWKWELETGRARATLEGHTDQVNACAVTPDGRHVVSASDDQTLKVWDLETYACLVTHHGDAPYLAVAATTTVIVAVDSAGGVWVLDVPPSQRSAPVPGIVKADPKQANLDGRARSSGPAWETRVTRDVLLARLSKLLSSQFEEVLFRARIPTAHLPGASAPQATRAIEAIRYLEQQNQLEQLARILEEVATGPRSPISIAGGVKPG